MVLLNVIVVEMYLAYFIFVARYALPFTRLSLPQPEDARTSSKRNPCCTSAIKPPLPEKPLLMSVSDVL